MDISVKDKGLVGFGPFQLDAGRRRLTRGGEAIRLPAKQFDMLLYFVENPNRIIEKDELLAAVWPGRIVEESSLTQTIYLLRRALQADEAERYIVAAPGRGYRFVADIVRPPQVSPGGMISPSDMPPAETVAVPRPAVSRAGYKGWALIAGVILGLVTLCVAALAWWRVPAPSGQPAFAPPPHSVAVLAFTNMSGDPGQEYLSDGISEEIINALSRINGLQVSARMSAFSFKGGNATIGEIARKLNVGAILEGSVRRDGARLRVTVQLINATTGYQYWSRSFDRENGGMLQLEADIAGAVAQSLEITLLGPEAARLTAGGTKNPLAFDAYLRGSSLARTFDLTSARAALPAFEAAIRLDPSFADAHAGRAFTLITIAIQDSTGDVPFAQVSAQALAEADRAVELAPESARAHAVRGAILHWRLDLKGAAAEVAQARALDGGDILVERTYALVEADLGRFAQAEDAARHMVALDPLTPAEYYFLAVYLDYNRKYAEALDVLRRETALGVVNPYRTALMTALAHQGLGDWPAAIQDCRAFPHDTCLAVTAIAEMKLGHVAQAHQAMAKLEPNGLSLTIAGVYAQWNDRPAALHWLDVATREHSPALSQIRQCQALDPVRDSPQYKNLERSIGLVP